jgi:L-threonylcarbamoyladenylate synthase
MKKRFEKEDFSIYAEEIRNCIKVLREGGTILYPTDTIWGIGCDATNEIAVAKIYTMKKRNEEKSMIALVANEWMLEQYVQEVPKAAFDFIENMEKPLTIIYPNAINLAKNLVSDDGTVGIRIIRDAFCAQLIQQFKKPIVSTSANISGQSAPNSFNDIDEEIISGVDYVVNLRQHEMNQNKPSTIIKIELNGVFKILRK